VFNLPRHRQQIVSCHRRFGLPFKSSVVRELRNFKQQVEAIDQVIK